MINFGPLTIYPQGISLLVAIVASSYFFWREGAKKKFEEEALLDFVLVTLVGGVIGGRLFYFLFEQNLTTQNFLQLFKVWQGGGTLWYGALVGGAVAGSIFAHYNFWDLKKISDVTVPALLLGQALGSFPSYPVEALSFLIIFLLFNHIRREDFPAGFWTAAYLIFASLLRFVFEFLRFEKTYLFGVNFNQVLSIVFFVVGVVGLSRMDIKKLKPKIKLPKKLPRIPFAKFKKQLSSEEEKLEKQQQKLAEENPLFEPGRTDSNPEMVAEAQEEISHRRFEAITGAIKGRLDQTKRALLRMKKGKYGLCEECGVEIDPARLKVDPSATLCLRCQEKKELTSPRN